MLFFSRIYIGDTERALVIRRGRLETILGPGTHTLVHAPSAVEVERHSITGLTFSSPWADFLFKERPALAAAHFTVIETGDDQVAMIFVDGKLSRVLGPGARAFYWKGVRDVSAEVVSATESPAVPACRLTALARLGAASLATFTAIDENRTGLLYLDGKFAGVLAPGVYGYWSVRSPRIEIVDLRRQSMEIAGQEILTKDKVTLRVNIVADYRVADAVKAGSAVQSFTSHFYRLLQLAVRSTLGRRTLDEVLAEKVDVDAEAAGQVRAEMAAIGVEVNSIALKDIILPGEIREILNQVVAAEKQAQANLIRRREETAATRSLLNTARLMEDNPILIRLKELETLERLTAKVDHVTVHGGFDGLLTKLLAPGEKKA